MGPRRAAACVLSASCALAPPPGGRGVAGGPEVRRHREACGRGDRGSCLRWGELERKRGARAAARKPFSRLCRRGVSRGCLNLGVVEEELGRLSRARRAYREACGGGSDKGCRALGRVAFKEGRFKEAASRLGASCGGGRAGDCAAGGLALERLGDHEGARLAHAEGCAAGDLFGCYNQARMELARGNRALAASLYARSCRGGDPGGCPGGGTGAAGTAGPPAPGSVRGALGSGSGFFISQWGHLLTNHHVIEGCRLVAVGGESGAPVPVRVVASDPSADLALLKSFSALPPWKGAFLRDRDAALGEDVVVAGYPWPGRLGRDLKVTKGAVSGTGRGSGKFQMDAAVQPGNSGGPVFDSAGNVVGVVFAKLHHKAVPRTGPPPENVNFGVHASTVRRFLEGAGLPSRPSVRTHPLKAVRREAEVRERAVMVLCLRDARRGRP